MSTHNGAGVIFSRVAEEDQQHFRLLELPAELLSLLKSDNPPTLELKSSEGVAGVEAGGNVVLCTSDKTWSLRQKNTSNTVHIVQSIQNSESKNIQLQAIAQPQSTLEATPIKVSLAAAYLKTLIPLYSSTGHHVAMEKFTKRELFDVIPFSEMQCEQAWRELAAFEMADTQRCFMPSAKLAIDLWCAALETAAANGIDLRRPLTSDDVEAIFDVKEDWPSELLQALLYAVSDPLEGGHRQIEVERCVTWVGVHQLEVGAAHDPISTEVLLSQWRDALPEQWRSMADVTKLDGHYDTSNGGKTIQFKEITLDSETAASTASAGGGKSTLGGKRKWHEKFRSVKKAG